MTPSRSRKGLTLAAVAAATVLALSACSGGGAPPQTQQSQGGGGGGGNSGYTFAMITHETPGDTFWDRIKSGANQAAKDTGSTLKYSSDPDATKQAVLIQNAIDSKVDGIATTLVTPDALIPTVKKAIAAGIPVDSFNSGFAYFQQAGALTHFSSDEFLAGQQAGKKVEAAGGKKILCTIQQTGSVAQEDRCKGVKDSFPNTENIQVNGADDSAVTSAIQAKLSQDVHRLGHHPRRPAGPGHHQGDSGGQEFGQGWHLRPQYRRGPGREGREAAVLHRPAALPAGLPGHHPALPLQEEREHHGRRQGGPDRPVLRRQQQHRPDPAVREVQHSLVPRWGRPGSAPASLGTDPDRSYP